MAQALTLFDSRHILIITSYDSWCGQLNQDLGLHLARHGAPNMSSYVPGGNCTHGFVFLLVAGECLTLQPVSSVCSLQMLQLD